MSPETELVLALDRIEGTSAILVDERGRQLVVPLDRLARSPPVREGDVLRIPLDGAQRPLWPQASVDRAETERRRAEALKPRDPGEDVTL